MTGESMMPVHIHWQGQDLTQVSMRWSGTEGLTISSHKSFL